MAPTLTGIDSLRLQRYVTLPTVLGGFVAPNPRFCPRLVRSQTTVATHQFLRSVRKKYGPRAWSWFPVWFPARSTLLVLDRDGIDEVLASESNFADPWVKKRALSCFTPFGVIVSRDEVWKTRRNLNNDALAFGQVKHPDADGFVSIVNGEVQQLLQDRSDVLVWDDFSTLAARISQQVIFGRGEFRPDVARHLGRLVAASNFLLRRRFHRRAVFKRINEQLDRQAGAHNPQEPLACRAGRWLTANTHAHGAEPPSQMAFWLFVMKDAIELHTVRTLALIASASEDVRLQLLEEIRAAGPLTADAVGKLDFLEACIREQLRLWTPVPILLRVAVKNFCLGGIRIRTGQQVLLHTGFYHRDTEVFGTSADRFCPKKRMDEPPLYVFSRHRQACAGQFLAIFLLKAVLAALLRQDNLVLHHHQPMVMDPVPAAIDQFALRFWRRPHDV